MGRVCVCVCPANLGNTTETPNHLNPQMFGTCGSTSTDLEINLAQQSNTRLVSPESELVVLANEDKACSDANCYYVSPKFEMRIKIP